MGKSYSPGLMVTDSYLIRKERILPIKGEVKGAMGDRVRAEDTVAVAMLPGKVIPINLANKLGTTPAMVQQYLKIQPGDKITEGQLLAETNGFLGFFKSSVKSPTDGEVENISKITGQMLLREPRIPLEVKAFIDGDVVEVREGDGVVVENRVAYIQGIFGLCGECVGTIDSPLESPEHQLEPGMINDSHAGKILVSGSMVDYDTIQKAIQCKVAAIITGGINDQDIKKLLGFDIGVAITGHENLGLTIVVTEGFGSIKMANRTFELLKRFNGRRASIHGKTQIRAGVMRPEVIIPLEEEEKKQAMKEPKPPILEIGSIIRVIREPNFGTIGTVTGLPEKLHIVESETKVRILEAKLETGEKVILPRANVEIIEA